MSRENVEAVRRAILTLARPPCATGSPVRSESRRRSDLLSDLASDGLMFIAAVIVSSLLAAVLTFSAIRKLSHRPEVVQTYTRVGVPEDKLNYLAVVLLAGAAALIVGFFWGPIGVAAGIGLVVYFAVAIASHIRANDVKNLPTPLVIEIMAVTALILRLETL